MSKSRRAPKYARRAVAKGADVLFVWGGDGTVQRCIDAVCGDGHGGGDPARGDRQPAGGEPAGFDARMISEADRSTKDSLGRAAYVVTGVRNLGARRVKATVEVDGTPFYKGKSRACWPRSRQDTRRDVGKILGGIEAFPEARPDDGRLELGVVTAGNPVQWARTLARPARGQAAVSPFVKVTQGKKFSIRFDQKVRYELDGGARPASKKLRIKVCNCSVTGCVPSGRRE